ncbi:MAG TPA: hypothetical protein PKC21_06610 [Oligoflexia bacterium]|nr:hypothetical protein [Oligoflexia bacterium]
MISKARFGYGMDFLDVLMLSLILIVVYTFSRIKKLHQNAYDANKVNSDYYKKNRKKWLWINYISCCIACFVFVILLLGNFKA